MPSLLATDRDTVPGNQCRCGSSRPVSKVSVLRICQSQWVENYGRNFGDAKTEAQNELQIPADFLQDGTSYQLLFAWQSPLEMQEEAL